jgi:hypothetical protein
MTKTKNVTVAIPERSYYEARIHAARHSMSLSCMVGFLLQHLPLIAPAVGNLLKANPKFSAERARGPYERRQG